MVDLSFSLYKGNQGIKSKDLKIVFRSYNSTGKTINIFPFITLKVQIVVKKKNHFCVSMFNSYFTPLIFSLKNSIIFNELICTNKFQKAERGGKNKKNEKDFNFLTEIPKKSN